MCFVMAGKRVMKLHYIPHDYQAYATAFIETHPVAAVFLEMGLGKTVITLTAIHDLIFDSFEVQKVLIIAPLRVARTTWAAECQKWEHLRPLRLSVAVGTEAERRAALQEQAEVYVINREQVDWLVNGSRLPFDFDMVVIDELSGFKSHQSKRFRALMKVRKKIQRMVGLTGTPTSNGLMDLWAEFKLLDMGQRLGKYLSEYRNTFFLPDKRNSTVIFSYKPKYGAEDAIYQRIADITISMRSAEHLQMPECLMTTVPVFLSPAERRTYDKLKKDMVVSLQGEEIDAANAASLSNKLLQMANGAVYGEDKQVLLLHSRKLDALEDLVEAANGKPVLVAYWFQHDRTRIAERMRKMGVVCRCINSAQSIADWNAGSIPVGLLHPAGAGHGLNLQTGGSHLIWFGLTWSLELYQQTNARLWRQGQTADTVVIQHIVTAGTMDDHVLTALQQKEQTQNSLMGAVRAELGGIP